MTSTVNALPIKIDEILVGIYYHFHLSVKSIVSLKDHPDFYEVEFKKILKHLKQDGFLQGIVSSVLQTCTLEAIPMFLPYLR